MGSYAGSLDVDNNQAGPKGPRFSRGEPGLEAVFEQYAWTCNRLKRDRGQTLKSLQIQLGLQANNLQAVDF
jgi:hypothetical protein